jgi:putative copper resistance protein D
MAMTEALVISRWIYFASAFALFGGSFFWFYTGLWPGSSLPRSFRATVLELRIAAALAAMSGLAWLAGIIANMTGGFENVVDPATLQAFFFETQFGPVAILRLALFAFVLAIALLPWANRAWFLAMLLGGVLLLVNQAWFGHAAEGGATLYGALMILVYTVHMLAGAAWVGGLVPLLLALMELLGSQPQKARERGLALLSRYSLMGMFVVTLILISGVANVAFHAVSPVKLLHSAYGEALFIKLSLVAGMLVLAYFNRFVAMPRLRAQSGTEQIATLRKSIGFELALGVLVIGGAAVLGITPPPQ